MAGGRGREVGKAGGKTDTEMETKWGQLKVSRNASINHDQA